ncbi:MAG: DUF4440 domain-containing protein [Bryobacteraceae bacterium]
MDDRYAINVAKTELREAYRNADVDGIVRLFSDSFTDMREGQASFWNIDAKTALRIGLEKLFREHDIEFVPTIIDIWVSSDIAVEHGWHDVTRRPKLGGTPATTRKRYVEVWRREADLGWRIVLLIDNDDQNPELLNRTNS